MVSKWSLFLLLSLTIIACTSGEKKFSAHNVPGIYVDTYKASVLNTSNGEILGARTVRDSIFIKAIEDDKYEVANRRWIMNDYDSNGWVTSMPGEVEAFPTYVTGYDGDSMILYPLQKDKMYPRLFFEGERVYRGEAKALEYLKVK